MTPHQHGVFTGACTIAFFVVLGCMLVSLSRDFYRPWVTARVFTRRREDREHEVWLTELRRMNRERLAGITAISAAMREIGVAAIEAGQAFARLNSHLGKSMEEVSRVARRPRPHK